MNIIRVLRAAGLVWAVLVLCLAGAAHAQYQGIWKDDPTDSDHNFYIQQYATGSMVVIYTTDAKTFFAFVGDLSFYAFIADSMGSGRLHLHIGFQSDAQADVHIVDSEASPPETTAFGMHKKFAAVRTVRSGIWKDAGNIFNMYVQDYDTGSTVVVYTFDGEHFQSFLGNVTDLTYVEPNMADQTIEFSLVFGDSDSGTAVAFSVPEGAEMFNYEVHKEFPPPALDVDWQCTPQSGPAPLTISFGDVSTIVNTDWSWDFGDGGTSTDPSPSYTYTTPGVYTVSLATSNGTVNVITTKTDYITVSAGPAKVSISGTVTLASPPHAPVAGVTVTFSNGGGSTTTNASGQYTMHLLSGWTGTVTPSKTGYTFMPPSRDYPVPLSSDQTDQDFDATAPIPSPIVVYTDAPGHDQVRPAVAYNYHHDQYLVVWHNQRLNNQDIYATRVTMGGQVLSWFSVSTGTHCTDPAVAYNGETNEYLVVWQQLNTATSPEAWEIYGRIIEYDKPGTEAPFQIAADSIYHLKLPKVAWNSFRNEYMVFWQTAEVVTGRLVALGRRRIGGDGGLGFGVHPVAISGGALGYPDIAYNVATDGYMVVWSLAVAAGNWDIQGMLIDREGSPIGGGTFDIAAGSDDQQAPAVCTNDQDAFVVVWQVSKSGQWDIHGRRLNVSGTLLGDELLLGTSADDETAPAVAAIGGGDTEYMLVSEQTTAAGGAINAIRFHTPPTGPTVFIQVASADSGDNANPAVGSHNTGFFVVYEFTPTASGSDSDIYGELY